MQLSLVQRYGNPLCHLGTRTRSRKVGHAQMQALPVEPAHVYAAGRPTVTFLYSGQTCSGHGGKSHATEIKGKALVINFRHNMEKGKGSFNTRRIIKGTVNEPS